MHRSDWAHCGLLEVTWLRPGWASVLYLNRLALVGSIESPFRGAFCCRLC